MPFGYLRRMVFFYKKEKRGTPKFSLLYELGIPLLLFPFRQSPRYRFFIRPSLYVPLQWASPKGEVFLFDKHLLRRVRAVIIYQKSDKPKGYSPPVNANSKRPKLRLWCSGRCHLLIVPILISILIYLLIYILIYFLNTFICRKVFLFLYFFQKILREKFLENFLVGCGGDRNEEFLEKILTTRCGRS